MTKSKYLLSSLLIVMACIPAGATGRDADPEQVTQALPAAPVWVLDIKGAIGPATAEYFTSGLQKAEEAAAQLVVLRMDTPGGLDTAMREMIKAILSTDIPVVSYVAPSGARAASAGTYLLYASHIAAMAPATNIGAATPVAIGSPTMPGPGNQDKEQGAGATANPMQNKIVNDAVAYIEGLAELRGRNAEWAARAVTDAASIAAEEALKIQVIDIVAENLEDLLRQLHGRRVTTNRGELTLNTAEARLVLHETDWRNEFLSVITNPSFAYILLLAGIYGLILEFSNPGMIGPGVIGTICLLLAFYAFQMLPVNYVGIALIALGIGLMVAEAFAPSFGILGLGGVVAFIFGSIVLMDTELPGFQIALPLILAVAAISALFLIIVLNMLLRTRKAVPVSGVSAMLGQQVIVENTFNEQPKVRINGELWQVSCDQALQVNDRVLVNAVDGTVLQVEKLGSGNNT